MAEEELEAGEPVSSIPEEQGERAFVVGIGASAGGLESLSALFSKLPPDLDIPYVVVQHLSPTHRSLLAQLIGRETSMRVVDIEDQVTPEPNTVYITPASWNLVYRDQRLHLVEPAKEVVPKPSVNTFLSSLAEQKGEDAIGVILSGTGSDGANGIRAVKAAGGFTFAQDPGTARYGGMPQSAINTGSVDFVLSPAEIAREIAAIARSRGVLRATREAAPTSLKALLARVRQRTRIDFSDYKETTLWRRIERRMAANHARSLDEYMALTAERPEELDRLCKDILISVTSFFRDREAFAALRGVLQEIARSRPDGAEIRAWIPGCATGEEAYSIAILLAELLGPRLNTVNVQIFATDIDTDALAAARRGLYPAAALADVEPALLSRYFTPRGDQLEVVKAVREMVLFARQDLVQDPPFLRLDLVSCRNVLIYFNPTLQSQVLSVFHYALTPGGALFLGKSESVLQHLGLYEPIHKEAKLFRRGLGAGAPALRGIGSLSLSREARAAAPARERSPEERLLAAGAAAYLPPCVLVDGALDIRYAHGDVGGLLEFPTGAPSHNVVRTVRKELRAEVQMLLYRAKQRRGSVRGAPHTLHGPGEPWTVRVAVHPVPPDAGNKASAEDAGGLFLVCFEPAQAPASGVEERGAEQDALALRTVRDELTTTREHLQTVVEELETSNEEMQALNEELQASNEELQATNEELETTNEELQSTNEELTTINEELQVKGAQLSAANADLLIIERDLRESQERLLAVMNNSTAVITVKDTAGRYEFVNARFEALTGLAAQAVLGKTDEQILPPELAARFRDRDLQVMQRRGPVESEDELAINGKRRWFLAIRFPVLTADGVIRAVCSKLTDITERKEIDRVKNEFISMVSHELRTPLTSIRGSLGLLAGGVAGELSPRARELVEVALRNSERLTRLVGDILDIERIEAGRLAFAVERQEIEPLVRQAMELGEGPAREYGVRLRLVEAAPGAAARVDGERLVQAVTNLLSNAAKFSPPGDEVAIAVRRRGGSVVISVSDRGRGIPEAFQPRVFEKFAQADSSDVRQKGGTGLGLAISKAIVEAMGGTIGFHANDGAGTTFTIELPEAT